ncbi:FRAS1-related extracellular matrix protein 1, partial [Elysia marginata]
YLQDGSDVQEDTFTLKLMDGNNHAIKKMTIQIVPIDDQTPTLSKNLRPQLIVSEGEEATISTRILAATDEDTNDESLVFLIVRQPRFGVLQLRGQPATKFSQQDVKAGRVSFLHTSGETGTSTIKDYATFIISDQNYRATADMPVYDLNITITPVNNQKPTILLGSPVFVAEGESFRFSDEVLKVSDPDSKTKEIQFMITRQPQWGFIENTKPAPGSEKDSSGIRVNSFTFGDILDGSVNYVQAKHRGVEPVKDDFEFYATDGKLNSDIRMVRITIVPANDEVPDLMLSDFSVVEGGSININPTLLDVIDMDVPRDQLKLSISKPPEHGSISLVVRTRRGLVKSPVQSLTVDELHSGAQLAYTHDGTEVFTDAFTVSVSDGKHDLKRVCNVSIKLHNDERPEVVKNKGLTLDYGDHALVSSLVLQSKDDDRDERQLYYILVEIPEKGFLQYCPDPLAPAVEMTCTDIELGENFTQTDVDLNRIRYIHTSSMGNTETDRFVFVLTDGTHKRHEETFEIRIRNSRKANIAVLNKGMVVREGERVAISTASLSASDESTRAEEIVFAVTRPPRLGQIENIQRQFVPISSFTQMDLASQRVVYHHLTKNDITADSFTFTVTNGLSEAKDGQFRISIQPMDRILPSLISNKLLEVLLGTVKPLTPLLLKATDPDTAAHNVTFTVEKPPVHGRLYNRGLLIKDTFTQNDVDLGFVTYESIGTEAGLDNFLFTVSDGRHEGFLVNGSKQTQPAMMSIFIQPLIEDAPRLMINKSPDLLQHLGRQRYGYKLTNANLRAVDADSDSASLYFIMTSRPKRGHLENIKAKRYVRRRFTQKDLDDESLLYIVDSKADSYADTFSFRVEDSRGNVLRDQHFQMSWSKVQFDREEIVLCENIGTLNIAVTRTGNLDQSAYVGVHIRGMSAKKGEDYIPKSSKQIQFDPGESQATWQLTIPDDGLEEPNEKLRLSLVDPVNTILGDSRKLRLVIINAQRGECPQYLGMISKHNPVDDLSPKLGAEIPTGQNADVVRQFHQLGGVPLDPSLDKKYLNTEAEIKTSGIGSPGSKGSQSASAPSSRRNKRKRGKGKKRRRRRKGKKRRNSKRKNRKSRKESPDTGGFDVTSPSYPDSARATSTSYQVPKRCTTVTKGLLHYDSFNLQLLKCDGRAWQPWTPNSGSDAAGSGASCQQGWYEYEGRCYKPVNERLSWDESEDKCIKMYNGHLTSLRSMRQLRWLAQKMERRAFWIGLNDKAVSGRWQFSNGEPVAFYNWRNGTPRIRRNGHKKNCVMVRKRLKFRNKHCDKYLARYVCEALPSKQVDPPKVATSSRKQRRGSRRHSRRQRQSNRYFGGS